MFEVTKNNCFGQIWFEKKIIAYVKNESSNFNAMTSTLKFVVNYETWGLHESFNGTCLWHDFSKACQYATINEKVYRNLKNVFIKIAEVDL